MARRSIWIVNGAPQVAEIHSDPAREWRLLDEQGAVRITSGPHGTELRWVVAAPHVLSLFAAKAMLEYLDGPFMLRFFSAGWFEERFGDVQEVRDRISALVMHADRHLTSRVFVEARDPESAGIPELLRHVFRDQAVAREQAVECCYEPEIGGFVVSHIGEHSAIGRIWGTAPSSFPCLATGAFGYSASQSYGRAVRERQPVYEQVIAALRFPDETLHWVPYHRVILPVETGPSRQSVMVACEYADVDFRVL